MRRATVEFELGDPGEPIQGQLEDDRGDKTPFSGWIGLVAAIEAARAARSPETAERANNDPTTEEEQR